MNHLERFILRADDPRADDYSAFMGARAELWQLYRSEKSRDVKEEIIQGLFIAGDVEHILELARTETDRELRLEPDEAALRFETTLPTAGRYRLFLQFQHEGDRKRVDVRVRMREGREAAVLVDALAGTEDVVAARWNP